jgi:hypothetical protein
MAQVTTHGENIMKSTQKAPLVVFVLLLLSAGLALATENTDTLNAKRVEALLLSLPGRVQTSGIEVKGDTLAVRGLTASLRMQEGAATVRTVLSIDEIACTGVNFAAADTPGIQRLAESVRITGYAVKVDVIAPSPKANTPSFSQKSLTRSASIQGLHGDVGALGKAAAGTGEITRLLRPLLSFKVDSASMEAWSTDVEMDNTRIRADINAFSAQNFGVLHSGPVKMEGCTLEVDGKKTLQIDSAGHESLRFTELAAPFLALDYTKPQAELEKEALLVLLTSLKDLSFSMEGLHITGMRTLMPELGDNSLRRIQGTLTASLAEVKLDGSVEDLSLSPTLYASFGPQGQVLADRYGKNIQFSAGIQATASNRLDGGSVSLHRLSVGESNLGNAALALKCAYAPGILMLLNSPNPPEVSVQEAELLLEDKGIGDLSFALMLAEGGEAPDAKRLASAREDAASGIRKAALGIGGQYAEAGEALAQLCEKSGKVTLRLRPDAPIPMDDIISFRPLKGLEVQYSAPGKEDAAPQNP